MKPLQFAILAGVIFSGFEDLLAFEIAKDGKASAAIVEGEKPSPATATAAKELARYQPVFSWPVCHLFRQTSLARIVPATPLEAS
jgi:hypothetical protein